jgi:glycosyltransferase involved in cell wall biosynthesis
MSSRFEAAGVKHYKVHPTPFNRLKLISVLRRERIDLVHACNPTAGDDVAFARRFVRQEPAFVMSIHGNLPDYVRGNRCLREASQLMTFDQSALDRLRKIGSLAEREIHLIHRPIERREMPERPTTTQRIVMVSRLSRSKGPVALTALEAVTQLQTEFPDISLTVVGEGSMRGEIQRRSEEVNQRSARKVAETVGMLVDPLPTMSDAACVVGTSYVALEALYHEIPVVAAGYEGYGDVTLDNLDAAIACNFGDGFPGLFEKVSREMCVEGFRKVLSMAATPEGRDHYRQIRERLEGNHRIEKVADRLETIYRSALEQARP